MQRPHLPQSVRSCRLLSGQERDRYPPYLAALTHRHDSVPLHRYGTFSGKDPCLDCGKQRPRPRTALAIPPRLPRLPAGDLIESIQSGEYDNDIRAIATACFDRREAIKPGPKKSAVKPPPKKPRRGVVWKKGQEPKQNPVRSGRPREATSSLGARHGRYNVPPLKNSLLSKYDGPRPAARSRLGLPRRWSSHLRHNGSQVRVPKMGGGLPIRVDR